MDAKTRSSLEAISNATVSMQLLKRGIRSVSMAGPKPMNTPTKPIVGEAFTLRYVPMREDLSTPEVLGGKDYPPRVAIESVHTPVGFAHRSHVRPPEDGGCDGKRPLPRFTLLEEKTTNS